MNIFSNLGITELILILLLALLVVGPERLPEMGRKLGQTLRDLRNAYDNLTRDLGPELMAMQETTQELRESVESVRSIPQDMVQSLVKATELEEAIGDLQDVRDSVGQIGATVSTAGQVLKDPVDAAVRTARSTLLPGESSDQAQGEEEATTEEPEAADSIAAKAEKQGAADSTAKVGQQGTVDTAPPAEEKEKTADSTAVEAGKQGLVEATPSVQENEKAASNAPEEEDLRPNDKTPAGQEGQESPDSPAVEQEDE
ncbi:twin-arginine translocase TatA/TatE family subunit [Chloroflexota bacterium]